MQVHSPRGRELHSQVIQFHNCPLNQFLHVLTGIFCVNDMASSTSSFTMNKARAGGGTSGASGPTAAAAATAAQKQKSLQQRVDNDIGSIIDNFSSVVNVARVCP